MSQGKCCSGCQTAGLRSGIGKQHKGKRGTTGMTSNTLDRPRLRVEPGWDQGTGVMVAGMDDYDPADSTGIAGLYETHVDRAIRQARQLGWEHTGTITGYDNDAEPVDIHTFDWNSAILDHATLWNLSQAVFPEAALRD